MTRPLLVLRPEPGASATVAAAHALGLEAIAVPLFTVRPVDWIIPERTPEAVLMTSANAARMAGAALHSLAPLPLYAVGAATAAAARDAGFTRIVAGEG
ncbi:MAG TPA: uroporphyrinogen-III synthase, partial [Sphingomonas sp.]|nr:uroporphyrinogen-III synthase [Sphingomonas sp.]